MALLTAEDVLNKAFSKTKYREGFDQDEVDDFLDEVANTIATLTAERDEYAARLSQAQAGGMVAPAVAATAPAAPVAQPAADATGTSLLQAATDPNPPSATSMLAMAQKLHDDYVTAGEAEKERLIAEARVEADAMLERAEKEAQGKLETLESERADLERKIDDLRRFERDYRSHLKSFLENLLGDLEHGAQKGESVTSGSGGITRPTSGAISQAPSAPAAPETGSAPAAPAVTEPFSAASPAQVPPQSTVESAPESAPQQAQPAAPAADQVPEPFKPLAAPAQSNGYVPEWPSQETPRP